MILVCHVILQDHVIKESCNFMSKILSAQFGGYRHYGSADLMFLVVEGQDSAWLA